MDSGPITAAKVDAEAFDPKAIAFARLTQTARDAIAQSRYPDARVTEWSSLGSGPTTGSSSIWSLPAPGRSRSSTRS